jgi:hypothetical protein
MILGLLRKWWEMKGVLNLDDRMEMGFYFSEEKRLWWDFVFYENL